MLILIYFAGVLLTMNSDALACYSSKHKYNIKSSFISSLLWFISVPLTIYSVWKTQQKDTDNDR